QYKAPPLIGNNGASNPLRKDSFSVVTDTVFFNTTLNPLIAWSKVTNLVTFKVNEFSNRVLPDSFTAKVKFRIDLYTSATSFTTEYDSLTIGYHKNTGYKRVATYVAATGYKAVVTLTHDIVIEGGAAAADVLPALMLENEIQVNRNYVFSCSSPIQTVSYANTVSAKGELEVSWPVQPTATEYDLEWSYIDSTARNGYYFAGSNNFDPAKIFTNNATRVSIAATGYAIPMMYDNGGILFFRVRPVQVLPGNQRREGAWSSVNTAGLGRFDYGGHERGLNWQSTTSFAEEGKRKTVVQYFDGTLRGRQTVTKDNTTGTTVVAETFYDYQGRPVIQTLPAPTLDQLIKHTPGFNQFTTAGYEKDIYDPVLTSGGALCNSAATAFNTAYGAAKYYSPQNPKVNEADEHRFIPDAMGYPYTETQYSTDGTDRVLKQSGVGPHYRVNSGKETRYYYSTADQEDLDLLFGTEAGVASHYSKNMVRDANGQYSVSYMDMHGRTVATALAGDHPAKMDTLLSKNSRSITKNMLDASNNTINGNTITSVKSFPVAKAGNYQFKYSLWPDSLNTTTCTGSAICYDCMYDLEVTVWGECYNNGAPLVVRRSNLRINPEDTACGTANIPLAIDTTVFLNEGEYIVTKKLTISTAGMEYLRDSVYLKKNLCRNEQSFIQEALDSIKKYLECERSCATCQAELGTWSSYREKYMTVNNIEPADSADFREEAWQSWLELKQECDEWCTNTGWHKNLRDAMLADVTPPSGQYANPPESGGSEAQITEFSIFKRVGLFSFYIRLYQLPQLLYKDEYGRPDTVLNNAGERVIPNQLNADEFTRQFKPSWAETLLPLHPEYCKLQKVEQAPLPDSYTWDEAFGAEDSYSVAINKGWLNPTANSTAPFNRYPLPNTTNRDPLFASGPLSAYKQQVEDSIRYKVNKGGGQYISMWALATLAAKCNTGDDNCINTYSSNNNAMDSTLLCRSEADKAWQMFRNMYLQEKREIIFKYLNTACPNTVPINPPYFSHFPNPDKAAALVNSYPGKPAVRDTVNAMIDAHCRSYVQHWWASLATCNFTAADSAIIIPKLINVCKEGGDSSRIFGSSTVRPGSTHPDKSFEQVLKDYCTANNIAYNANCNAYLITAPRPYHQQNWLADEVVITKPDTCQCQRMDEYRAQYIRYKQPGESYAAYLKRTINSNLTTGQLDTLQKACNGALNCKFLAEPIVLPPAFQCNVKNACIGCAELRTLQQRYNTEFPGATPVKEPASATEEHHNRLFAGFMNHHTGFNKAAWEYLGFLDSCAPLPSPGCDSLLTVLKNFRHLQSNERVTYGGITQDNVNYAGPDSMVASGILRFPDWVRKLPGNWYNNLYLNYTPYFCFPDGYEAEVRLKILPDTTYILNGTVYYMNYLNAMPSISRYVTPLYHNGVTYPPGMFLEIIHGNGIIPGQDHIRMIVPDTNSVFDWQ
ncbi:MAG: hypothetical protein JNM68_00285, partial [Dinghuibacter sp.]|nr:hypothetical protein [Dinghuibacter sp.]